MLVFFGCCFNEFFRSLCDNEIYRAMHICTSSAIFWKKFINVFFPEKQPTKKNVSVIFTFVKTTNQKKHVSVIFTFVLYLFSVQLSNEDLVIKYAEVADWYAQFFLHCVSVFVLCVCVLCFHIRL